MLFYVIALIVAFFYFYNVLQDSGGRKIELLFAAIFFLRFILPAPIIAGGYSSVGMNAPFNDHLLEIYSISFIVVAIASTLARQIFKGYSVKMIELRNTEAVYDGLFLFLSFYFIAYLFYLGDIPLLSALSDAGDSVKGVRLRATHNKEFDYRGSIFYGSNIIVNFLIPILGSKYILKPSGKSLWKYFALAITILSVLYLMRKSQFIVYILAIYYLLFIIGKVNRAGLLRVGVAGVVVLLMFYSFYGYSIDDNIFERIFYRAFVEESSSSYLQYQFFYDPEKYHFEYIDLPFSEFLFGYKPVNLKQLVFERMWYDQVQRSGLVGNAQGFSMLFLLMAYQKFAYLIFGLVAFLTFGMTAVLERSIHKTDNTWLLLVLTFSILINFPNYLGVNILTIFTSTFLSPSYLILITLFLVLAKAKITRYRNA